MRPELILWDWNGTLLDDVELCGRGFWLVWSLP